MWGGQGRLHLFVMATEQVNGIVHVTQTRAIFLEFIDAIQVEELGELGHFLIFIAKGFDVKKNAGLQIQQIGMEEHMLLKFGKKSQPQLCH